MIAFNSTRWRSGILWATTYQPSIQGLLYSLMPFMVVRVIHLSRVLHNIYALWSQSTSCELSVAGFIPLPSLLPSSSVSETHNPFWNTSSYISVKARHGHIIVSSVVMNNSVMPLHSVQQFIKKTRCLKFRKIVQKNGYSSGFYNNHKFDIILLEYSAIIPATLSSPI